MEITTVSLDKATRDELSSVKEQQELPTYDETIEWLIDEVTTDN